MLGTYRLNIALLSVLASSSIATLVYAGDNPSSLDANVVFNDIQLAAKQTDVQDAHDLDGPIEAMESRLRELQMLQDETITELNRLQQARDTADAHFLQRVHIDLTGLTLSTEETTTLLGSAPTSKQRRSLAIRKWLQITMP